MPEFFAIAMVALISVGLLFLWFHIVATIWELLVLEIEDLRLNRQHRREHR